MQSTSVSDIEAPGHKTRRVLRDDDSSNTLTWTDDGSQSTIADKSQITKVTYISLDKYRVLTGVDELLGQVDR